MRTLSPKPSVETTGLILKELQTEATGGQFQSQKVMKLAELMGKGGRERTEGNGHFQAQSRNVGRNS